MDQVYKHIKNRDIKMALNVWPEDKDIKKYYTIFEILYYQYFGQLIKS